MPFRCRAFRIHAGSIRRTVRAGGEAFNFVPGERLQCGSWSHVFVATWHALDAYGALMLTAPIRSLPAIAE